MIMHSILKSLENFSYSLFTGSRRANIQRFLVLLIILFTNILYTLYTDTVLRKKISDLKEEISRPFHSSRVENDDLIRQEMIALNQKCGVNSCVSKISIKKEKDNYFLYFYDVICYDKKNGEYRSYSTSNKSNPVYHSWNQVDRNSQIFTLSIREKVTKIDRDFAAKNGLILFQRLFSAFDKTFPIRAVHIAPWYFKENLDWILIVSYRDGTFGSQCESSPELLYSTNNKIEKYWKTSTQVSEGNIPLFNVDEK